MSQTKFLLLFTFLLSGLLIVACGDDTNDTPNPNANSTYTEAADCTSNNPTYTNDIKAILDANCATAGCHNATTASSGIDLSDYNGSASAVNTSSFLCSIHHGDGDCSHMPQGGPKMSDANITAITCWVKNGMPQ